MENSLTILCDGIKKVLSRLKPQSNSLSFVIVIGKTEQGKSTLLKQSGMEMVSLWTEDQAKIYYNPNGIMLELGEKWYSESKILLQNTLKKLNRCNHYLKITGIVYCVEVNDLLISDRDEFIEQKNAHLQLLERWGINLGYRVELALVITKMDTLAGFIEFYQSHHNSDLSKALGFSLECVNESSQKVKIYNHQFHQFIESLDHQVISKMHPVRSTIRRSLIREFPLQVASLRGPIQSLLQGIAPNLFNLHSIYFCSSEQCGSSIDRLNKKIQNEYALVVQDTFPQAANYRAYFVEGALKSIQINSAQTPQSLRFSHKSLSALTAGIAVLCLGILSYYHHHTALVLDEASKELLAYDVLNHQQKQNPQAIYHLNNAAKKLSSISSNPLSLPTMHQLKNNLTVDSMRHIQHQFLPSLLNEIETVITNPGNTTLIRYNALKVYLMLGQKEHFSAEKIANWFSTKWKYENLKSAKNRLTLLNQTFENTHATFTINNQIVNDARNYLNALPSSYLYYSLAKEFFPADSKKINFSGFSLAAPEIPVYYTRDGYQQLIKKIPEISSLLQKENWVLQRQDNNELPSILTQAYAFDYVTWWQAFVRKTQPEHYQNYQQARETIQRIEQSHALSSLVTLIQNETKADMDNMGSSFNRDIAAKFTELNLLSSSSLNELDLKIKDLAHFNTTISMINDEGKTAFNLTKARFLSDGGSDSISQLFNQARQLPEPLNVWAKQLATDTWALLIKDSRQYINKQWTDVVYQEYKNTISQRYPLDSSQTQEIAISDFNHFFSTNGTLNTFTEQFIKPFLDVSNAEWKSKVVNDSIMPIEKDTLDNLIRANIITTMFFPDSGNQSRIEFSLQKINLDPVVSSLDLEVGQTTLHDNQGSESITRFNWPQNNAKLSLNSIEGNHYELSELGQWALFKLLEKVNVLVDEQDSSSLQILFEINSNSGRYLLKTNNQINPFTPGILNGFTLNSAIV